jgi:uncharacterized membrane protein YeiH
VTAADLQPVIEHAGVAVGAISGVLAAEEKRVDLFGVLVLALAAAFGGGTTRDLLLSEKPVSWLRDPALMLNALSAALITFFAGRWVKKLGRILNVVDAVSLAFFVMLGTGKGLDEGLPPATAMLLGVITGVAGGILRDVLLRELPAVFRREIHLYATAALAGAGVNVLLQPAGPVVATSSGFFTILFIRLAAMRWKISLPEFSTKPK